MLPVRALACVALVISGAGCNGPKAADEPARLVAIDQSSQDLPPSAGGAVFSLRIANHGDDAVAVGTPVASADAAVEVEVLGISDCRNGCVGAGPLDAASERQARQSVDSSLTAVPPSSAAARGSGRGLVAVVVALRWREPSDARACSYLRSITFDGRTVVTGPDGAWLAAIGPEGGPSC